MSQSFAYVSPHSLGALTRPENNHLLSTSLSLPRACRGPNDTDPPVTLVAIDDDPESLNLIRDGLSLNGLEVLCASEPEEGLNLIARFHPDIVLLDLCMPGLGGLEVLDRIMSFAPCTDVILITGQYSTETAVRAIQRGACDYVNKPLSVPGLRRRVGGLMEEARRRNLGRSLGVELLNTSNFQGMVGASPLIVEVFAHIRKVAPHFRNALITGATGTGKELAAAALHRLSPGAPGNFVVCNASAVVESLFESELFGHVRGAFTGANHDKMGLFEHAHGGTLFLDEIGDMPLATQAKLLRVLQSQEVQRVGSLVSRKMDVRVIAATNRDLRTMIAERRFREDLFYRLSMVQIKLPRLAERREDLALLTRHFIEIFGRQYRKTIRDLTPRAQIALSGYRWPGNVRELENIMAHACMMTEGEMIDVRDLPEELRTGAAEFAPEDEQMLSLGELDRRHALRVMKRMGGNKTQAAKILGINRSTLHRLLGQHEDASEATSYHSSS
jgi:DNA-binding NtrC family response regulator